MGKRTIRAKFILPALTEAKSPYWRPIKYSLFPPLGLATLAGHMAEDDLITLADEHVEEVTADDDPELVVIQTYVTNSSRAYQLADIYRARGAFVALGGLHATAMPDEASRHTDAVFIGPGEDTFPRFLKDYREGHPRRVYVNSRRTLEATPPVRRDLIRRHLYLVPNSVVVSRGCPHHCDFCYKDAFFENGRSFYTQRVDRALEEIEGLPGRHLYFLDDHLLGSPSFAESLFEGMRGMNRVFQAAATVESVLRGDLIEKAAEAGLRSLFVGFETLNPENLIASNKPQNLRQQYDLAIKRLHDLGIMINGSFVFGLDEDKEDVFERTVEWAVQRGITTATFHILTPYPGTRLFKQMERQGRILHRNWPDYDTRQVVFKPRRMNAETLKAGYDRAYGEFYRWRNIYEAAWSHDSMKHRMKHLAYAGAWKRMEPMWNLLIKGGRIHLARPLLEAVLSEIRAQKKQFCRKAVEA
jgi:radical SAM superfamily enzyme YgiQ (UPF0313 family)